MEGPYGDSKQGNSLFGGVGGGWAVSAKSSWRPMPAAGVQPMLQKTQRIQWCGPGIAAAAVWQAKGPVPCLCTLVTPPLLNHDAHTVTKLRSKHPQAAPARPALVPLGPPSTADVPDITAGGFDEPFRGGAAPAQRAPLACDGHCPC